MLNNLNKSKRLNIKITIKKSMSSVEICRHSRRTPRKLQLLAFRQVVQSASDIDLKFISEIPLLWNYFAHIKFIISSQYHIARNGRCMTIVHIVPGCNLIKHITTKLSCRKFDINFWCLECNSFCSKCIDFFEFDEYKYTTQIADCKKCLNERN